MKQKNKTKGKQNAGENNIFTKCKQGRVKGEKKFEKYPRSRTLNNSGSWSIMFFLISWMLYKSDPEDHKD